MTAWMVRLLRWFFGMDVDYDLQQQMAAVRAVIDSGPRPRLRIRFEKPDERYRRVL